MNVRRLAVPDVILCLLKAAYCALALALWAACKSIAELLRKPFRPESKIIIMHENQLNE